ncbi:serine/threonine protein kinase [Streptomyces olivaceus]|uniref:serine/threonine-protein kinase n=1 Tax=Streptomyces olivaceus TaxID=47716 RepID=UPI0018A86CAE|nr:serine/threonine-protein kinase [Streptomyces olivaceus]MBF8175398.1 serine/threonine protein kinase [Streptomyces olivaceus]
MQELGDGDPTQIGGYRLLGRLGTGGMGHVHLARSDRGRTVAVKLVREELAAREEFRARFRYEVEAARRVGGHWTAPVLDADTEAAVPWVATGYVAGPSLQQVVGHDHGPLPERSVRTLAAGLAHALRDIHAAGIVHRDLKPSNVLLTIDGPRVIDFGIARALETVSDDGGVTRTGALVGSPGFMAPEQVRGDGITPACDVFCLGSILVYAATGKLPFGTARTGAHAVMFRIAQEEPDLEGVPEALVDLVRDCLEKDPAARPGLAEVLRRTGAQDTVADGRSHEPWLPSPLVAQLGRHAVSLLDTENPEPLTPPAPEAPPMPTPTPVPVPVPEAAPVGEPAPAPPPIHPTTVVTDQSPPPHPFSPQPPSVHQPPPSRKAGGTALLVVVALVVALGAGGAVYALMSGDGDHREPLRAETSPAARNPAGAGAPDGSIPTAYLGTWTATIDNESGIHTRRLTIRQGDVGDTVLSLTADGPAGDATYHCVFEADLAKAPGSDGPVRVGLSTVTAAEPPSSCTPGEPTTLTLQPNGSLRRATNDSGDNLTYTRQ